MTRMRSSILSLFFLFACGPSVRRDLSTLPQRRITYDDMCHLQDFFDDRESAHGPDFRSPDEHVTEAQRDAPSPQGAPRRGIVGEGEYIVSDGPARARLRRMILEEYKDVDANHPALNAEVLHVEVGWWSTGPVRRLRPDRPVVLVAGPRRLELPFHPCIGELLFARSLYRMRHELVSPPASPPPAALTSEIPPPPTPDSPPPAATPGS